jgi:stearoyl-CoA desaturase (delta-9 desaturase)
MVGDHANALRAEERLDWVRSIPFFFVHAVGLIGPFFVTITRADIFVALGRCALGIFVVTAFYHRYFSHRSYQTSRAFQFVMALLCTWTLQKGPAWWASHHRHHHQHSDQEDDIHSYFLRGLYWSHVGWILCPKYHKTDQGKVKDLLAYPELRWLDRGVNHLWMPVAFAATLFWVGGWSMLVLGFFTSTVFLWHDTFLINSLAHKIGRRRYETSDQSRNSWILALATWGEGWHNNHHRYQGSVRQGFRWWEIDLTYYLLKLMSWTRVIWSLHQPPKQLI